MNYKRFIWIGVIASGFLSCNRVNYIEPETPITPASTFVLAHGASGNSDYKKNSLEAAINALNELDGIEIDVIFSKDGTLWLSHDSDVKSLSKSFIKSTDQEISEVLDTDGNPYYDKLEDVLAYASQLSSFKFISLDYKYSAGTFIGSHFKNSAEEISRLVNEYQLTGKIAVECDLPFFLKDVNKSNSTIETYYMCLGNFDKGLSKSDQKGLTGISFDYGRADTLNLERIELAHSLGLKVLVYTINEEEIKTVHAIKPDIIQTDNLDYYDILNN